MDAERRRGDESLRDGVSAPSRGRLCRCAGSRRRSRSISAATPRSPARTRCGRSACRDDAAALSHAQRPADGDAGRRVDRARLSRQRRASAPMRRRLLLESLGVASRSTSGATSSTTSSKSRPKTSVRALEPDHARLRTIPVRGVIVTARSSTARVRFRLALLRARIGRRRGPGHRLGALRADAVLGARNSARTR